MITLNKLRPEDIDEKIKLNENDGINIYKLREMLYEELLDFRWVELRAKVQCQCLEEQLTHIDKKILELKKEAVNNILDSACLGPEGAR